MPEQTQFNDGPSPYQPLVSVVIPTWNRPEMLRRAIESVRSQSYSAWEIVVADEGGSDKTENVVRGFGDPRIRYYRHETRLGFLGNWTFGVRHASGEWIAILGDDDYYLSDFILNRVEMIRSHPSVVAVAGTYICKSEDGVEMWRSPAFATGEGVVYGSDIVLVRGGRSGDWFIGATLYRRQLVDEAWERVLYAGTAIDIALDCYLATMENAGLGLLQRWDMVLTRHGEQESITNQFALGRGGAVFALVMASVEADRLRGRRGWHRWLAAKVNEHARQNWDCGNVSAARALHMAELLIWPFRFMSWLRLARALVCVKSPWEKN